MNIIKKAFVLWKEEKKNKGTTLQRRLVLFFLCVTTFLVLAFTLLLMLFGITGKEDKTISGYVEDELAAITNSVTEDFGVLSLDGINLAEELSEQSEKFFEENGVTAAQLKVHPEVLEELLEAQVQTLLNVIDTRSCGGVFVMLDASVKGQEDSENSKAGIFIKKTQPIYTQSIGVKAFCLRGPAQIARNHGLELLAQWKMEYDTLGEEFLMEVMETARNYPDLPLSRLYYWSGRVTLEGNSEAGFLLCVPLRTSDGTVFGVCGIEVSDRMFKELYSPSGSTYENAFAMAAPSVDNGLKTSQGIIAGNYYLTGKRMSEDAVLQELKGDFEIYQVGQETYGGKSAVLRLYPSGSPYEEQKWSVVVLMPEELLTTLIKGNSSYFILIVILLLLVSLAASIFISRYYIQPVTTAFESIRNNTYEGTYTAPYLEINDLFDFLAQKDKVHEERLRLLDKQKQDVQNKYDKAQTDIYRLAGKQIEEIDPDSYDIFVKSVHMLTPKEAEIFALYLDGKSAKDIMELVNINENTLKYHNRNIYSKLGVSSRKQLLKYATLMKQEEKA